VGVGLDGEVVRLVGLQGGRLLFGGEGVVSVVLERFNLQSRRGVVARVLPLLGLRHRVLRGK